jgi:hypothetical protein
VTQRASSRSIGSRHIPREHHAFNVNGRNHTRPVTGEGGEQHIPEKSRHSSYRNPTLGSYTEAPHVSEVTPNKFDSSELSTPRIAILRIFRQLGCTKPYRRRSSYPTHRHVGPLLHHILWEDIIASILLVGANVPVTNSNEKQIRRNGVTERKSGSEQSVIRQLRETGAAPSSLPPPSEPGSPRFPPVPGSAAEEEGALCVRHSVSPPSSSIR